MGTISQPSDVSATFTPSQLPPTLAAQQHGASPAVLVSSSMWGTCSALQLNALASAEDLASSRSPISCEAIQGGSHPPSSLSTRTDGVSLPIHVAALPLPAPALAADFRLTPTDGTESRGVATAASTTVETAMQTSSPAPKGGAGGELGAANTPDPKKTLAASATARPRSASPCLNHRSIVFVPLDVRAGLPSSSSSTAPHTPVMSTSHPTFGPPFSSGGGGLDGGGSSGTHDVFSSPGGSVLIATTLPLPASPALLSAVPYFPLPSAPLSVHSNSVHVPCATVGPEEDVQCTICLSSTQDAIELDDEGQQSPCAAAAPAEGVCSAFGGHPDTPQPAPPALHFVAVSLSPMTSACRRATAPEEDDIPCGSVVATNNPQGSPAELGTKVGSPMLKLRCGHCFHRNCLQRWLLQERWCPMCRCPLDRPLEK